MKPKDPIVEEVHLVRERLAREAGDNLERLFEAAKARQAASGRPSVTLRPRKSPVSRKAC
ncbi:MAG: hypothetical protein HY706_01735 [Candidatus Hydrogenedentes bacterium]|nr:hypothetical protein [Candidatus Hydrogenedentota bacterium]